MKPLPPCRDCDRRNSTCHIEGNCKAYEQFLKDYDDWVNMIKKEKDTNSAYRSCVMSWRNTALKQHH